MTKLILCPRCEYNTSLDGIELCSVCQAEYSKKVERVTEETLRDRKNLYDEVNLKNIKDSLIQESK